MSELIPFILDLLSFSLKVSVFILAPAILIVRQLMNWSVNVVNERGNPSIKPVHTINTQTVASEESLIAQNEDNDCTVRALMAAFDVSYDEAHHYARVWFERTDKEGVTTFDIKCYFKFMEKHGITYNGFKVRRKTDIKDGSLKAKIVSFVLEDAVNVHAREIVKNWGRYYILVDGHALASVDGVLYDNCDNPIWLDWRVRHVWEIYPENTCTVN